jgi:hypothetical protein
MSARKITNTEANTETEKMDLKTPTAVKKTSLNKTPAPSLSNEEGCN